MTLTASQVVVIAVVAAVFGLGAYLSGYERGKRREIDRMSALFDTVRAVAIYGERERVAREARQKTGRPWGSE